jgi:hypothetical protein
MEIKITSENWGVVKAAGVHVGIVPFGLPNTKEKWCSFEGDIRFHRVVKVNIGRVGLLRSSSVS